jgi:hypothetical protein
MSVPGILVLRIGALNKTPLTRTVQTGLDKCFMLPAPQKTKLLGEIEKVIYFGINDKRIKQVSKTAWHV